MKRTNRVLFLVAVVSLALTAGSAIAQQKSEGTRAPGALQPDNIVNLAAIEAVQKDLGVSPDVASKLTLLRDEYRAAVQKEYQDAGINPRDYPNSMTDEQRRKYAEIGQKLNDEFIPKAKELLTADQNKRYQQIQFQYRLSGNGPRALLAPDLASELKLRDDQQQKLNALSSELSQKQSDLMAGVGGQKTTGGGFRIARGAASAEFRDGLAKLREEHRTKAIEVLTAEQKESLTRLKGNEFDVSRIVLLAPPGAIAPGSSIAQQRGGGWATEPESNNWSLLRAKAVQNDLGLSDEVASKLDSLRADSQAALEKEYQDAGLNPRNLGDMTAEQRQKLRDIQNKNNDELSPKVKELLSADQYKRFRQVQFQYRLRQSSDMALQIPDVAAELKLTDDQRRTLRTIGVEFTRAIPSFVGTNRQDHQDEYNAKAIDVLTAEQKETLDKLKGNELDLSMFFPRTIMFKRN